MDITGEYQIPARREVVFAALKDPAALEASFGAVSFSDASEPERITIDGAVPGAAAGSARRRAVVTLAEDGSSTLLRYVITADSGAARLAESFFAALSARLGGERSVNAPSLATPGYDEAAEDELVDRIEHRVDDQATHIADVAEEVEEELEVAAGRGVLGGPYVWGLIALLVVIVALAILR